MISIFSFILSQAFYCSFIFNLHVYAFTGSAIVWPLTVFHLSTNFYYLLQILEQYLSTKNKKQKALVYAALMKLASNQCEGRAEKDTLHTVLEECITHRHKAKFQGLGWWRWLIIERMMSQWRTMNSHSGVGLVPWLKKAELKLEKAKTDAIFFNDWYLNNIEPAL